MKIQHEFVRNRRSSFFILTLTEPHQVETDGVVARCQDRYNNSLDWLNSCENDNFQSIELGKLDLQRALEELETEKASPAYGRRLRISVDYGGEDLASYFADLMRQLGVIESSRWEE